MKISSIIGIFTDNEKYDKDEDKNPRTSATTLSGQDERNYYLEKEIENIRQKWNLFKYTDEKFHIFKITTPNQDSVVASPDIKKIRFIKDVIFSGNKQK